MQHDHATTVAITHHVDAIAADVNRLRRQAEPESSLAHLADRLAGHVESIDAIVQPNAHDLYLEHLAIAGSTADALCLDAALRFTEQRQRQLRQQLGMEAL